MKEFNLDNWEAKEETEGLLFFAQRAREMLFDYTLDTFKPSALNTSLLCEELLITIKQVENANIESNNLNAILDELKWAFSKDPVAKTLIEGRQKDYIEDLDLNNRKELQTRIQLLYNKLREEKYISACQLFLTKATQNANEKKLIEQLSRQYITALIDFGYSQSYLYNKTREFFFGSNKINSSSDIEEFFKFFPLSNVEYDLVFIGSPMFEQVKDSCEGFGIEILKKIDLPGLKKWSREFLDSKRPKQLYLKLNEINALDEQSAKEIAESRLTKISNLYAFYHHKKKLSWSNKAIICRSENNKINILLSPTTAAITKGSDNRIDKAAKKLNLILRRMVELEPDSFAKFNTVIDLHGIAITNRDHENQLLNLWIGLETLVPSQPGKTKIHSVTECLVPFLKFKYLNRIIESIGKDLVRWNRPLIEEIVETISGSKEFTDEAFFQLIALAEYEDQRRKIYQELGSEILLRYRLFTFSQHFKSGKNLKSLIDNHEKKVIWQIRRVYRARNLIVHSGRHPRNIETLIENLHTYLDTFLNHLVDMVVNDLQVTSIGQAIKEVKLLTEYHDRILTDNKGDIDDMSIFTPIINGR
ncbi:hypothetical protein [Fulvivirga sediminis]|uniref:Apea-like HEPN domain-containing protein n=1 Tax=Fulvivirga sediminis TaxID=2803949 RepID=A0A937FBA8_9BACT|nr:hypothetical protein [Fulvivirga sediminis]MBL3658816.1 hypothetical protein [Fulvivirga sediminis]